MTGFVRRVVTGHDNNGKAVVISDGIAPSERANPFVPGMRSSDIWKTTAMPVPLTPVEPDPTTGPRDFVSPMGTKIRISEIPPDTEVLELTPEQAREMFKHSGSNLTSTFERGGRHPMMHRSESIDYAVVLEGELTLVLDEEDVQLKTGDVVIQRGTNHSWSNRSGKLARILYILIDGRFEPGLAAQFKAGRRS